MTTRPLQRIDPATVLPETVGPIIVTLIGLFWVSIVLQPLGPIVQILRVPTALLLLLFVPGGLLASYLNLGSESFGVFVLYAIGLSLAVTAMLTVCLSLLFPVVGFSAPLSVISLGVTSSVGLLAALPLVRSSDVGLWKFSRYRFEVTPVVVLASTLPSVAAVAAVLLTRDGNPVGMYLFVSAVLGVVLLSSTDLIPRKWYPVVLVSVAFSVLLHRNLLTGHVVGADIQAIYATSELVLETGRWSADVVRTSISLPVVTAVPAAVATLAGIELTTVFKVVYVFLFSLVPLGMYYIGRDVFDSETAFFGGLFFMFYHVSFTFTPGKQLVSELFAVLIVLTLFEQPTTAARRKLVVALLSVGVVFTHYGMTYVLSISLLVAALGLLAVDTVRQFDSRLSVEYPIGLFAGGTVWYGYASEGLIATLISIPASVVSQVESLLTTGIVPGTGAAYVGGQTGLLDQLHLGLYVVLTGFIAVGLVYRIIDHGLQLQRGTEPSNPEYTALAVPLFVLLGLSYFVIPNLWADRMYQLVLPVLAPLAGVGYLVMTKLPRHVAGLPSFTTVARSQWLVFAVLLCGLFALGSGFAFGLAGTSQASAFNPDANDRTFDQDERAGVQWLDTHVVDQRDEPVAPPSSSTLEADRPAETQIYTDLVTGQLFRSELPENTHRVEVLLLKNRWEPTIDDRRIDEGYILIRERAVTTKPAGTDVSPSFLSVAELNTVTDSRNVVFSNGAVRIVRTTGPNRR